MLWHCWLGGRNGIWPVKKWGDGGGQHWLVRMEWPCLPLLIFLCTVKSRSSLLAPAHLGGPGKRTVKRLWWWRHKKSTTVTTVRSEVPTCINLMLFMSTSPLRHSGMACVTLIISSHLTHTFIHKWNDTYLPLLPSYWVKLHLGRYSFSIPLRVEGWVGLGGWLQTEVVYVPADSHPSQS